MAHYNHQRLHSAIGFVTPADMLAGRAEAIWAARDRKLEAARVRRHATWQTASPAEHPGRPVLTAVH